MKPEIPYGPLLQVLCHWISTKLLTPQFTSPGYGDSREEEE